MGSGSAVGLSQSGPTEANRVETLRHSIVYKRDTVDTVGNANSSTYRAQASVSHKLYDRERLGLRLKVLKELAY